MSTSYNKVEWDIDKVRWVAPYEHSFAYRLFKNHFTEINNAYWSGVPAYNTIKKNALAYSSKNPNKTPLDFFTVHDEDDRRIANSFDKWKNDYALFAKFNRLNMMIVVTSCMEVYLRTIISLAFESRPDVLFYGSEAVDGVFPMIRDKRYSKYGDKKYPFYRAVNNICSGNWSDRYNSYKKSFGENGFLSESLTKLNNYRKKRNDYAHHFGRLGKEYENPVLLEPKELVSISHKSLISYFALVDKIIVNIDEHLYRQYIGGYEIIKYIHQNNIFNSLSGTDRDKAKKLADIMGKNKLMPLGTDYFQCIIEYMNGVCKKK